MTLQDAPRRTLRNHSMPSARSDIIEFAKWGEPSVRLSDLREASIRSKSPWLNFYWDRIGDATYREYVRKHYRPFLDAVLEELAPGDIAAEVGCGIGTVTKILTDERDRYGGPFVALDICQYMVEVARAQLAGVATVLHADMRTCGWVRAPVIHGHGVLEHLSDHDIYRTIESHAKSGCRAAIHYVPGIYHLEPSFGDERLMPLEWWVNKWDVTEAHTFNDGRDYILIWRF